jgi:hypothetical protein
MRGRSASSVPPSGAGVRHLECNVSLTMVRMGPLDDFHRTQGRAVEPA